MPDLEKSAEQAEEEVVEEEEDEPANAPPVAAGKKKKKKKNKKKATGSAAPLLGAGVSAFYSWPDTEFDSYVKKVLEETKVADLPEPEKLLELPKKFQYYSFTGTLRPAYVSKRVTCPPSITLPDYGESSVSISEQEEKPGIHVYSPEEIAKVRHACVIGREVLDIAGRFVKAGVTGDEIDRLVHQACMERNAYPSPLNYYSFPKSVCVSANEVICHGIPDFRPLQDGDIVNIDVSVYVDGYHADLNEMFMIGEVDDESKGLVKSSYMALAAAATMIKPGTFYRDVGAEISRVATKGNCAVVKKYSGHGTGYLFHCNPSVPHYANNKAIGIMRPGHIFTIEPMLNVGTNWGDVLWPDNWTAVTKDGKRSAQFEHTFLVTETGCEILTARPGTSKTEMIWDEALEARLTRPGSTKKN